MAKILKCSDLMPGCNFVAEGATVDEVLAKGAAHAKKDHAVTEIRPDMGEKVKALIKDK